MKVADWKYLNKMPAAFRAKTYPELKELCRLKFAAEKAKGINRSIQDAKILLTNEHPGLLSVFKKYKDSVYGTASGTGWFSADDARNHLVNTLTWSDIEFASFFITVWNPEGNNLWISIKDL